ncbi:hypothetical protein IV203_020855 [Nitzschia inconspicua]|uniref:Uncharacterized protein n=1 Tax=Nitzschia inconspicua TaxID=303405 RepID=A0A9K3PDF0_9STRA|nr:hypothetical protein IV203_020855 [Nitzschia inconspicua]
MTSRQDGNHYQDGEPNDDEETPLLLGSRRSAQPTNFGSSLDGDGPSISPSLSSSPIFVTEHNQRQWIIRRRQTIVAILTLAVLSLLTFDGVGHTSISWKRNQNKKDHKKKKSKTDPPSNWWADSAAMQLVRQARRNFSKIVVIVVNDQRGGDDDDDDQDEKDAKREEQNNEKGQQSNSKTGNKNSSTNGNRGGATRQDDTNEYLDDDNVKTQVNSKESQNTNTDESDGDRKSSGKNNASDGNKSSGSSSDEQVKDANECQPQDWKCWRDKYQTLSKGGNESNSSTQTQELSSSVDSAEKDDTTDTSDETVSSEDAIAAATSPTASPVSDPTTQESVDEDVVPILGVSAKTADVVAAKDERTDNDETSPKDGIQSQEGNQTVGTLNTRSVAQTSVSSKKLSKKDDKARSYKDDDMKEIKALDKKKSEGVSYCEDGKYSKRTLKLAYEIPFQGLFRDTKGQNKFEASSVTVVDDVAYAICDSSWSISMFDPYLHPFGEHNHQIGDPNREVEDSGYEALFYDHGIFYVVRESVQDSNKTYHAIIEELILDTKVNHDTYDFGKACPTEFEFDGNSKGFEGAVPIHDLNGNLVVLGLCEGNHCSESKELQQDKGNGRLVAMREETLADGTCQWSTIRVIKIPMTAYFGDYSSIDIDGSGRVIISSQEESQLWVGQMDGIQPDGLWDVMGMEFRSDIHTIYDFPKNDNCETMYCNIEGVHWVDDHTIIAVSDKMKGKGRQPYSCFEKDQSAHLFVFP